MSGIILNRVSHKTFTNADPVALDSEINAFCKSEQYGRYIATLMSAYDGLIVVTLVYVRGGSVED